MEFSTKDLLVTVLPRPELSKDAAKLCLFRTMICRFPSLQCLTVSYGCANKCTFYHTLCIPCSKIISNCGHCSIFITGGGGCQFFASCGGPGGSACDPTYYCIGTQDPWVIQHMEDLVTLKAELQATLKSLDAIQKEGLPSALGSKQEAEALERGLTEALEQVRAAKKTL